MLPPMLDGISVVLRDWRLSQKPKAWTQAEAARHCDMTRGEWSMIEAGHRVELRDETYAKLAAGTGLSEEYLRRAATRSQVLKLEERLNPVPA